ncbi:unnamed protein product [Rhizoctonia solani]|uniref:Methyltransferase type 11 domain-containing protein n=1 Tax=Rhizoctonia solani TaxID=456999 RepID=A0A8H3HSJ2_9AGAM|nr:unnamed protein product [Rhizoctonia solani]
MAASPELACEPKDSWSASLYNQHLSFVYADVQTRPVLELLAPRKGDHILDLGCGSGEITVQVQDFIGERGIVVGVDLSQSMLDKARENGLRELFLCDIQNLVMPSDYKHLTGSFDAVFSNATLHWCKKDPRAAVRAAKQALKPGGRFVGEFCGDSCAIEIRSMIYQVLTARGLNPSALDPWYLPGPEEYKRVLEAEGFKVEHIFLNSRVFEFPGSLLGFIHTLYRDNFFGGMSDEEADRAMNEVCTLCEPIMKLKTGAWSGIYVTLRFSAIAPF